MNSVFSVRKFNQIITAKHRSNTLDVIIDFKSVVHDVNKEIIFDYCRKVFHRQFHFDYEGRGSETGFDVTRYSGIVNASGSATIFGTYEISDYSKPGMLVIKAEHLMVTDEEIQAVNELRNKFSNSEIKTFDEQSI